MMKKIIAILLLLISCSVAKMTYGANPKSYIVYDVNTGVVLTGSNINEPSLIASTTKILTALVALENMDIMQKVEVSSEDVKMEGSKVYFIEGQHLLLVDAIYGLMLRSGNDCANLIARSYKEGYHAFIALMNEKAKELGMKNSLFMNPSGLDEVDNNISTAYDMALLMSKAIKNEYFITIASAHTYQFQTLEGKKYHFVNKDKSVTSDERFIAGKTGYTKKSGRILVNYAKAYEREVVIVTINDGNDFNNHKIYLENLKSYISYTILKKGRYKIEDYIVTINEDIKIPLLKERKNDYYYILKIAHQSTLGIYLDDSFIYEFKVLIEDD